MTTDRRVALVTGGARRIGAAICRRLHGAGYDVALHFRASAADAAALDSELNGLRADSCRSYAVDLLGREECGQLARQVLADLRQVDLLVNNASAWFPTPLDSCAEAEWDRLLGTNLKSPFFLAQALASSLRESRGNIVNIIDAYTGAPRRHYSAYTISKNGLADLTRNLAAELAPDVRVNGVAPGAILWPESGEAPWDESRRETMLRQIPLHRLGAPQDIAEAVLFLAQAPYITGQVLAVDGGVSLRATR